LVTISAANDMNCKTLLARPTAASASRGMFSASKERYESDVRLEVWWEGNSQAEGFQKVLC
jgi:hypothetical protein